MEPHKNSAEIQGSESSAPAPVPPQQPPRRTKKWLLLGGLALVLIGAVVLAIFLTRDRSHNTNQDTNGSAQPPSAFLQQYGQNCQNKEVAFTSPPLKQDDLGYIRPLGAVSDGHVTPTDHVYVGPTNPSAADNTYPVLMPADGTVVQIDAMPAQYIGDRSGQQVAPDDHRIVIEHSCRYFSIYIHVHKLSDALKAAAGDLQPSQNKSVNVPLKAGDTVGYIGGSTFDWTPVDTTQTLKGFMTPKLYEGEPWKIHTVSPFDLYTGSLKTTLEAKSLRSVAPVGGKIDYDQAGKLVGNWFRHETGGYAGNNKDSGGRYWDGHLSVAPDYIDPASTVVSIGNWTGSAAQFVVSGEANPARVDATNGMVKYELKKLSYVTADNQPWSGNMFTTGVRPTQQGNIEGTIAFQVLPGEKLKVEKFPGKTAAQVTAFTDAAENYER